MSFYSHFHVLVTLTFWKTFSFNMQQCPLKPYFQASNRLLSQRHYAHTCSYFIFALFVPKAVGSSEVRFNFMVSQGSYCACTYPSDGRRLVKLKFMDFYKMEANGTSSNKKHNLF